VLFWLREVASDFAPVVVFLFFGLVTIALVALCYFLAEVLPKP
jgi:hypothetical protein